MDPSSTEGDRQRDGRMVHSRKNREDWSTEGRGYTRRRKHWCKGSLEKNGFTLISHRLCLSLKCSLYASFATSFEVHTAVAATLFAAASASKQAVLSTSANGEKTIFQIRFEVPFSHSTCFSHGGLWETGQSEQQCSFLYCERPICGLPPPYQNKATKGKKRPPHPFEGFSQMCDTRQSDSIRRGYLVVFQQLFLQRV